MSERKTRPTVPHDKWVRERLSADGEFAREYLQAAIEEDEPKVLLFALRDLAEARGMAQVAEASGIPRESLYRALGPRGNPRFSTLAAIMKAIGMRLTVHAQVLLGNDLRKTTAASGKPSFRQRSDVYPLLRQRVTTQANPSVPQTKPSPGQRSGRGSRKR
ncbi:MAG: addiction module antidote protein [Gammaproteobacteria bacterium]